VTRVPSSATGWIASRHGLPEHSYRLARSLAASGVPHTVHVFAHGPHSPGLARGAGDAEIWTSLAGTWIRDQP
jgi:hypothetical protein